MELTCPLCQGKLTVATAFSSQLVRCPLCAGSFQAPDPPQATPAAEPAIHSDQTPLLPPDLTLKEIETPTFHIEEVAPPSLPPIPAPQPAKWQSTGDQFSLAPETGTTDVAPIPPVAEPIIGSGDLACATGLPVAMPIATEPSTTSPTATETDAIPAKSAAKSDYRHSSVIYLRRQTLAWIAPVGFTIVFFLSFFPWESGSDFRSMNLWQLAFTSYGYMTFRLYILLFFLTWPFSIAALMLQKKWLPPSPQLKPLVPWLSLALAGPTLIAFFLFLAHYVHVNFYGPTNPSTIWMKIAFRVHLVVVVGTLTHFWLERRNARKMPEPRLTLRW